MAIEALLLHAEVDEPAAAQVLRDIVDSLEGEARQQFFEAWNLAKDAYEARTSAPWGRPAGRIRLYDVAAFVRDSE